MTAQEEAKVGKFGKIALELGLVNAGQIQECLAVQIDFERSGRDVPKLGTLLLAKGYLDSKQVKLILEAQNTAKQEVGAAVNAPRNLVEDYQPGAVIFREDDHERLDMFLLQHGTVELRKRGVKLLERSGEGVFIGITSCLMRIPRSATAIAATRCRVFRIPAAKAQDFFKTRPEMAFKLALLLAQNLFALKNKCVEATLAAKAARPAASSAPALPAGTPARAPVIAAPAGVNLSAAIPAPRPVAVRPVDPFAEKFITPKPVLPIASTPAVPPARSEKKPAPVGASPATAGSFSAEEFIAMAQQTAAPATPAAGSRPDAIREKVKTAGTSAPTAADSSSLGRSFFDDEIPAAIELEEQPAPARISSRFADSGYGTDDERESLPGEADDSAGEANGEGAEEGEEGEEDNTPADELYDDKQAPPPPLPLGDPITDASPEGLRNLISGLKVGLLPSAVVVSVEERIALLLEIEKLEEQRQKIDQDDAEQLPDSVKNELNRQRREVQRIPPLAALLTAQEKTALRLDPPPPVVDPETGVVPPAPPALEPLLRKVYELGQQQRKYLIDRARGTLRMLRACAAAAAAEPLYRIFARYKLGAENLFGWGIYGLALREYGDAQPERIKQIRVELDQLAEQEKNRGFLGLGRKAPEENARRRHRLEEEDKRRKLIMVNVNRELGAIEKSMVDEFWRIYALVAQRLVAGVSGAEAPFMRAYLRWGLLGHSTRWMPQEKCLRILADCQAAPLEPTFRMDATHIYYADELMLLISQGKLPPTANEDLELNQRNSPLWKADRSWRRIINCRMQEGILRHTMLNLETELRAVRAEQVRQEEDLVKAQARANDKDRKRLIAQSRHNIQNCKVKGGRLERLIDKIREEMLPKNADERSQADVSLIDSGITFTPEDLTTHEVKCMRRNARLVAKLKEPFLPYTLRERYKPEIKCAFDRQMAAEAVADAEIRDPLVFQEPLVAGAKKMHRVLMRTSPVLVIAPAGGIMGFMMCPRTGMESGRLVVPAYFERTGMGEEILWNTLADFRFDTSKASAGVDLMNSDTLVAAYAEVRWNLRKRDKEVRQKAGIYMEENERTNWRRHYAIYMKSALESGKLLFYKCPELYELIINKFVDLPGGADILKR